MEPKNFAVIGHPVGHTMSPFIHARLFALCGVRARYGALDIPPESLAASLPRLRALDGCNVTIPHKRAILPLLDGVDKRAAAAGSVNTVKSEGGRLTGFTTDGEGFRRALEAAGIPLRGKVTVLGAGGAARACAFEAALAGCRVTVAARAHSLPAARALCAQLNRAVPGAEAAPRPIDGLRGPADLLVNATPAGMFPRTDACPVPEETVARAACVFDAVYNPAETDLLRLARRHGKRAVGGMGMLVRQAAAAQEIWLGARFAEADLRRLCAEASLEMKKKFGSVVLCGVMGSGKTSAGRLLAEKTGRPFADLDARIAERAGESIPQIFAGRGEAGFRALEREAVLALAPKCGLVVAVGGGTFLDPRNAAAFRARGAVVFLDVPPQAARARLAGDRTRPLLRGGEAQFLRLYAARRAACRAAADFTVDAAGTPEQTARAVLKVLAPAT